MSIRLGDTAPDFSAESTAGPIKFHEYLGDGWGILFSHPRDYTPVCTTELGTVASLKSEFEARNVKVVGLSVDWSLPSSSERPSHWISHAGSSSHMKTPCGDTRGSEGRRGVWVVVWRHGSAGIVDVVR